MGGETNEHPREVCEFALAHVNTDRVDAAYLRIPVGRVAAGGLRLRQ